MAWIDFLAAQLWQHVWAVIPPALIAAVACRLSRCGPVTRHGLWVVVLLWFILPPLLPKAPSAGWLRGVEADLAAESRPESTASKEAAAQANDILVTAPEAPASYILPRRPARTIPPQASDGAQCARAAVRRRWRPAEQARVSAGEHLPAPSTERDTTLAASRDGCSIDPFELAADAAAPPRASNTDGAAPVTSTTPLTERHSAIATRSDRPRSGGWSQPATAAPLRSPVGRPAETRGVPAVEPQSPHDNTLATPAPRAWQVWWRSWVAAALVVRATLARLPAIPAGVWLAGAALVLGWNMLGVAVFWRRMRRSVRPPAWVVSEVRWVARRLKLRQVPTIRMVPARIPPLVWCGWQPVLVLPVELWRTLDSIGRCAILCHELAHLRRRDHWVRRLDMLVALLFWWHPVAWWTRRRVEDEADTCCDAWVTWLMPRERRAYAEALLKTRVFIEKTKRATPVLGAAVTTSGAKRLARRVTMVMTQSVRPRQSVSGLMLATVVVVVGWMLTPAVSIAQQAAAVTEAPGAAIVATAPPPADRAAPVAPAVPLFAPPSSDAPAAPAPPLFAPPPRAAPAAPWVVAGEAPSSADSAEPVTRTYKLAPGKLAALADLLAREDVPLKIRRQADAIEVIAPPRDQDAFAAFVRAIDAQEETKEWRAYPLPAGKLAALYKLMARQDVPIMVSQEDGVLRAEVTPSQDAILRGFLALIDSESATAPPPRATSRGGRQRRTGVAIPAPAPTPTPTPMPFGVAVPMPPVPPVAPTPPTPPPARPDAARRARAEARQAYVQELRAREEARRGQSEAKAATLRQKAAEVLEQAAQLEAEVERLQAEVERLSENAGEGPDNAARERQLRAQARELERQARQLARQMERLNALSEDLEGQADEEDARVDELNGRIEEFEAQLEEMEAELEEGADEEVDDAGVSVWGDDDAIVLSDPATTYFDLAAAYGSTKLWRNASPFNALTETYAIGTPGLPLVVQPQVSIALQKALEGVRSAAGGARGAVRDEVRQSLRTAFARAGRAVDLGERDFEQLAEQISALVDAKVSAAIERALAGVELHVSVAGLPCQVTAEATTGCRPEAQKPDAVGAEEREPLP